MATNVFGSCQLYGETWEVVERRGFNDAEKNCVRSTCVVNNQHNQPEKTVCFFMKGGGLTYIPLSEMGADLPLGSSVDMNSAKLVKLHREGDGTIVRVEVDRTFEHDSSTSNKSFLESENEKLNSKNSDLINEIKKLKLDYQKLWKEHDELKRKFKSSKAISLKVYIGTIAVALCIVAYLLIQR